MARRETAARRYAEAAFQIGREEGAIERWEADLERLRAALEEPTLRALAEHPAVPYAEKARVIRRVVSGVSDGPLKLVLLMIRRGRPGAIGAMVDHVAALVRRHRGVVLAEVRSALELEDAQREKLAGRLAEMTESKVQMTEVVDESLIGGVMIRIGDQLYDGSVRSRLERLRARLAAG